MHLRSTQKQSREVYIDETIGSDKDGNSMTLADVLIPDDADVYDTVQSKLDANRLYRAMEKVLTETERSIIIRRYGLGNTRRQTQKEIADSLGISRSYVSRIEKRCLKALIDEMREGVGGEQFAKQIVGVLRSNKCRSKGFALTLPCMRGFSPSRSHCGAAAPHVPLH